METSLRAQIGGEAANQPTIAILCEYDALPGVGHGCGHNVMCANSVGAFLALAELEKSHPGALGGRVILQTTPAEECDTAKEILAQRGMLEGVDAAIQTHSYAYDLVDQAWLGVRRMRVVFHGVSAHAASAPLYGPQRPGRSDGGAGGHGFAASAHAALRPYARGGYRRWAGT